MKRAFGFLMVFSVVFVLTSATTRAADICTIECGNTDATIAVNSLVFREATCGPCDPLGTCFTRDLRARTNISVTVGDCSATFPRDVYFCQKITKTTGGTTTDICTQCDTVSVDAGNNVQAEFQCTAPSAGTYGYAAAVNDPTGGSCSDCSLSNCDQNNCVGACDQEAWDVACMVVLD